MILKRNPTIRSRPTVSWTARRLPSSGGITTSGACCCIRFVNSTYVDAFNLLGAVVVQIEQVLDPQQIIEPQRNGRYQLADRQMDVQAEISLQQYGRQQSDAVLVLEVEMDLAVQALREKRRTDYRRETKKRVGPTVRGGEETTALTVVAYFLNSG